MKSAGLRGSPSNVVSNWFEKHTTWMCADPRRAMLEHSLQKTRGSALCYHYRMTASRATLRRLIRARDALHADPCRGATLDELAAVSGLSRGFLARTFARTFGVPPHQYLVQLRLEQAKRALARGASVTETCLEVGFESLGSFSASFHRRVGMSPRAWQRRSRALVQGLGVPALYIPACFLARYFEHV